MNILFAGSHWKHKRTGSVQRVRSIDARTNTVYLLDPAGRETSVNPDQLECLYFETDDPGDVGRFPVEKPAELILNLPPAAPVPVVYEPLPDRRRFNHGSTKQLKGN